MTGYDLSRNWFDHSFEHPDLVKTRHTALFFYIVDRCNRLGWKEKVGLPTGFTMEAVNIGNYNTYHKTLLDLVEWKFIYLIQKSKNQYTSNVIALCKSVKATSKALEKATLNQNYSTVGITKQQTIKTLNNKLLTEIEISEVPEDLIIPYKYALIFHKSIIDNLKSKGLPVTKYEKVKFKNYIDPVKQMIEEDGVSISQIERMLNFLKNPKNEFWNKIVTDTRILRKNSTKILLASEVKNPMSISEDNSQSLTEKLRRYE